MSTLLAPPSGTTAPPRRARATVRSLCLINQHYPCDGSDATRASVRAEAFATAGVAVHVIGASPGARREIVVHSGVIVHRVPLSTEAAQSWSDVALAEYRVLERQVDFEVLLVEEGLPELTVAPGTELFIGELPDLEAIVPPRRLPSVCRAPTQVGPRLGIIVCAGAAHGAARRVVTSVLAHTDVPFHLIVTTSTPPGVAPPWLEGLDDPGVEVLTGVTLPAARNAALERLDGSEELVVFLDAQVEVLAGWWAGFAAVLDTDPEAGLVGEHGWSLSWEAGRATIGLPSPAGAAPCDVVASSCAVLRRETLSRLGRLDERLDASAQLLDLSVRAARLGGRTWSAATGLVLELDIPGAPELSEGDCAVIAAKHARQTLAATTPFLVLVAAEEVLECPTLLADYGAAFTAGDEVALVAFGPGVDPQRFSEGIAAAAERSGFDLESGPRVIALLPPVASPDDARTVGEEVFAVLSNEHPTGVFADLAWIRGGDPASLRDLAARVWRARPA